jgi:hypothetical protein
VKRIPESEADWKRKRKIVMQVSEMWGAFVGSPISRQSLKFFWLEECIEGGEFRLIAAAGGTGLHGSRESLLRRDV